MNGPPSWRWKARQNVAEWGEQEIDTLLLAAQEELGELTQAHLEGEHEDGDAERLQEELDDLAALCYQLQWAIDHATAVSRPEAGEGSA